MTIHFRVFGNPIPQPRQRHTMKIAADGRFVQWNYTPSKHPVKPWKLSVQLVARAECAAPLEGPLVLDVTFLLPRPKAMRWKRKAMSREWWPHKPDTDNLVKALKDAVKGILWIDDSQVVMVVARKLLAGQEEPGAIVQVTPA